MEGKKITSRKVNLKCKVNLYLKSQKPANADTPIRAFASYGGHRIFIHSVGNIQPRYWNPRTKAVREGANVPGNLSALQDDLKSKGKVITDTFDAHVSKYKQFPEPGLFRQLCINALTNEGTENEAPKDLIAFTEQFIREAEAGTRLNSREEPITENTIKIYRTALKNFEAFRDENIGTYDLGFQSINFEVFNAYKQFLANEKQYRKNSAGKHLRVFKSLINEARARGLTNAVFTGKAYEVPREKTKAVYLKEDELQQLFDLDLSHKPTYEAVRDLFLVGCWTGLRFSDLTTIRPENIQGGFIRKRMRKTGGEVVIPILPMVETIIQRYKGKTENSLPPPTANAVMNRYLKDIAKLAGINGTESMEYTKAGQLVTLNKPKYLLITTHSARRTFCTNFFDNREAYGLTVADIMSLSGHQTESAFYTYIQRRKEDIAAKVRQGFMRAQLKKVPGGDE